MRQREREREKPMTKPRKRGVVEERKAAQSPRAARADYLKATVRRTAACVEAAAAKPSQGAAARRGAHPSAGGRPRKVSANQSSGQFQNPLVRRAAQVQTAPIASCSGTGAAVSGHPSNQQGPAQIQPGAQWRNTLASLAHRQAPRRHGNNTKDRRGIPPKTVPIAVKWFSKFCSPSIESVAPRAICAKNFSIVREICGQILPGSAAR